MPNWFFMTSELYAPISPAQVTTPGILSTQAIFAPRSAQEIAQGQPLLPAPTTTTS